MAIEPVVTFGPDRFMIEVSAQNRSRRHRRQAQRLAHGGIGQLAGMDVQPRRQMLVLGAGARISKSIEPRAAPQPSAEALSERPPVIAKKKKPAVVKPVESSGDEESENTSGVTDSATPEATQAPVQVPVQAPAPTAPSEDSAPVD